MNEATNLLFFLSGMPEFKIEKQEEGGFVALSEEYSGAVGQGETEEEAIEDLKKAIKFLKEIEEDEKVHKELDWYNEIEWCVARVPPTFTLKDIYEFEKELKRKHPKNKNIRAKIRQQLQVMVKREILKRVEEGKYKKIHFWSQFGSQLP